MAQYKQNDCKEGRTVVAPIPKAIKSVIEVMVMAEPACLKAIPKRNFRSLESSSGS